MSNATARVDFFTLLESNGLFVDYVSCFVIPSYPDTQQVDSRATGTRNDTKTRYTMIHRGI
jgi:hypothetical protein